MKLTFQSAELKPVNIPISKMTCVAYETSLAPKTETALLSYIQDKFPDYNVNIVDVVCGIRETSIYVRLDEKC